MPRKTKELVQALVMALLCLAIIIFVGGPVATIVGIIGVLFFGGGAALLFFRPEGLQSTGTSKPATVRAGSPTPATPAVTRTLSDADRAAAMAHCAVFQRFGVVTDGVEEADWFLNACAGVASPGRPLTPDDVLVAFDELSYSEPRLVSSEVAPNLASISLEFEGDVDEVMAQLQDIAGLIEPDVNVTSELSGSQLQLRVGASSATVELGSALSEGRRSGYYIAAYVALAELYRRNQTGFRLAIMAVDFTGYVVRIPDDSVDELNAELGLTIEDYNQLVWLDLPSNDIDDMSSVTFEEA